jgi:hypothetical protein
MVFTWLTLSFAPNRLMIADALSRELFNAATA